MTLEGEYENNNNSENTTNKIPLKDKICFKILSVFDELKVLFSQPYLKYLAVTCFADFGLMARLGNTKTQTFVLQYIFQLLHFGYVVS